MEHNYFDPILNMDEVLEFVSPSHPGMEWLDRPQESWASMNERTITPDYQLIDKGQKTTKEGQLKRTYGFLSCGCMD